MSTHVMCGHFFFILLILCITRRDKCKIPDRKGGRRKFGKLHMWAKGTERMCHHLPIREYFGSSDPKTCATSQKLGLGAHFSQHMPKSR